MNSRLIRILVVVIAIAIGLSAGYLFKTIDNTILAQLASADLVREQASALTATIADVRTGQAAYVARGQGEAFWMSRVESLLPTLQKNTEQFAGSLTSPAAQSTFEQVKGALENFRTLDAKVRNLVEGGSPLLAADMIFSDGLESVATASTQATLALGEELQHRNGSLAELRSRQIAVLGGAGIVVLALMAALALTGTSGTKTAEPEAVTAAPVIEPVRFEAPLPKARAAVTPKLLNDRTAVPRALRVADSTEPAGTLERAARVPMVRHHVGWRPSVRLGPSAEVQTGVVAGSTQNDKGARSSPNRRQEAQKATS